jgi:hypothetical protein
MPRSLAVALATLLLALPAAALAQTTATGAVDPAACAEPSGASTGSTPTVASSGDLSSGGTPASATDSAVSSSSNGGAGATAAPPEAGAMPSENCAAPVATVAQEPEPEPEPEGPGEPQPDEPGGEPRPPTLEEPIDVPAAEAPATAGGLPRTGLQALKLALLGLVLLLVGARLRVLAKRRRTRAKRARSSAAAYRAHPGLAPDGLPHAAPGASAASGSFEEAAVGPDEYPQVEHAPAAAAHPPQRRRRGRDEWSFPDPREPTPTGLLPSTAMARRKARERDLQES